MQKIGADSVAAGPHEDTADDARDGDLEHAAQSTLHTAIRSAATLRTLAVDRIDVANQGHSCV